MATSKEITLGKEERDKDSENWIFLGNFFSVFLFHFIGKIGRPAGYFGNNGYISYDVAYTSISDISEYLVFYIIRFILICF